MLLSLAAVALLNAGAAPVPLTTDELPALFVAACLDGGATTDQHRQRNSDRDSNITMSVFVDGNTNVTAQGATCIQMEGSLS